MNLAIAKAQSDSAQYIASYNIWMHHLVDEKGARLFPAKMRLLSHWNLRDEIKSDYADGAAGAAKQRAIRKVMERIVDQTIPRAVLDNPGVDWNPFTNEVRPAAVKDSDLPAKEAVSTSSGPEPDTRYATLISLLPRRPPGRSVLARGPDVHRAKFEDDRQIPEARVRKMLEDVLSSPARPESRGSDREAAGPARSPRSTSGIPASGRSPRGRPPSSTRSCARSTRRPRPTRRTSRTSS